MVDEPLELASRRRIYEYVRDHPGAYVREIMTGLAMPQGQANYHLDRLESRGLLVSSKEEYHKRYFLAGTVPREQRGLARFLKARVPRAVLLALLAEPGQQHGPLAAKVGVTAPTLTYHIKRLEASGLIERATQGSHVSYRIPDPEAVVDAMVTFQRTIMDGAVDRFLAGWLELSPRHLAPAPPPAPEARPAAEAGNAKEKEQEASGGAGRAGGSG